MIQDGRMVYIALGANLGDRAAAFGEVLSAIDEEAALELVEASPVFETDPIGPGSQGPYLNAVLRLRTTWDAFALLDFLQGIEAALGRDRSVSETRWGPRVIDLDILFYEDSLIDSPRLVVPHPRAHERLFVLVPMLALDPEFEHPIFRSTIRELADALPNRDSVRSGPIPPGWPA